MLGRAPIAWSSKRQASVSQSSYKFEYYTLSEAKKEKMQLRLLLQELGHIFAAQTVIWANNQVLIFPDNDEYSLIMGSCNERAGITEKE